jgi:hypothetical protein
MDKFILMVSMITVLLIILVSFMDLGKSGYFIQTVSPIGLTIGVSASIAAVGILFAFLWNK